MPHSRLAADLSAAACPCRSAILLRRRLLLIHELARILVALGPDAFAHGLAAKLGALPDCAFPGIVSDRFVGSHSFLLPILSEHQPRRSDRVPERPHRASTRRR